ncbi:hypothetical protein ACWCQN_45260, partial [Streptomyces sp. NPDC001984]
PCHPRGRSRGRAVGAGRQHSGRGVEAAAEADRVQDLGETSIQAHPERWTVERTYGWLMLHRRPARDYENRPARSEAMIYLAMADLRARRLTGENTISWRDSAKRHQPQIPG